MLFDVKVFDVIVDLILQFNLQCFCYALSNIEIVFYAQSLET